MMVHFAQKSIEMSLSRLVHNDIALCVTLI